MSQRTRVLSMSIHSLHLILVHSRTFLACRQHQQWPALCERQLSRGRREERSETAEDTTELFFYTHTCNGERQERNGGG
eukprot:36849-Eustigmatos_ZCMA.PRE.1